MIQTLNSHTHEYTTLLFFVFFVISKHVHSQDLKWNKIDQEIWLGYNTIYNPIQ